METIFCKVGPIFQEPCAHRAPRLKLWMHHWTFKSAEHSLETCGNAAMTRPLDPSLVTQWSTVSSIQVITPHINHVKNCLLFLLTIIIYLREKTHHHFNSWVFIDEWHYCRVSEHTMDAGPFLEFFVFMIFKHACILLHEAAFFFSIANPVLI